MKKILLGLLVLCLFASVSSATQLGQGLGDYFSATIEVVGDIYSTAYAEYSETSTITGWSSYAVKEIWYKKVGNLVYVWFNLTGTSNATSTSFTLPYSRPANPAVYFYFPLAMAQDNGSWGRGNCEIANNAATVLCEFNESSTWTNSGGKIVKGFIVYEME